jgi:hypothetical protein
MAMKATTVTGSAELSWHVGVAKHPALQRTQMEKLFLAKPLQGQKHHRKGVRQA